MKGETRESVSSKLFVGFAESKVIAISPDNEKLRGIGYNIGEDKDEPNYLKEKDGFDTLRLDFIMQEVKTGYKYKRTFFLEDKNATTKWSEKLNIEEKDFKPKYQFINQTGDSFYAESEELLPIFFTNFMKGKGEERKPFAEKEVRIAKVGEAALMNYIKVWLKYDYMKPSTNIFLDMKDLFKGKFNELSSEINGDKDQTVVDLLTVNRVEKEGDVKEYQSVYKTVLPGYLIKTLRNIDFSEEVVDTWRSDKRDKVSNPEGRYLKNYEELAIEFTDKQYGSKDYGELELLKEYDESKNPAANPVAEPSSSGY